LPDPVLTVTDGHTRDDEALIGQALNAFNGRLGYQVFGEVRSGPADQARLFMTKALGVG